MTLEAKIVAFGNPAVKRLNIPGFGSAEGIHQVVLRAGPVGGMGIPTTSFSQVHGMGETWALELIRRAGAVMAYEARYATQNEKYNRPTPVLSGPTSDLARDPRWGRNDESYSEDPFLAGTMATALAKGIQGDDPRYWQAAALVKHFFANNNETTRVPMTVNPMQLVRVKNVSKRLERPSVLTAEEFHKLRLHVREPYRTMVLIAGCLGLRASENVGLQWRDLYFQRSTLLVQRGVVHGRVDDVKTEYSRDAVPIAPELVKELMEYRSRCYPTEEGWLFANPATGKP